MRALRPISAGTILPLVASGGSVYAWTKWYPPLAVPSRHALRSLASTTQPFGAGLSPTHGLATPHGTLGVVAAVACVAGTIGLFLPGRLKLAAAGLVALSSAVIAVNGLSAYLNASSVRSAWDTASDLYRSLERGGLAAALTGVSGVITRHSLVPSGGAAAAGGVGFLGSVHGLRASIHALRVDADAALMRPPSLG